MDSKIDRDVKSFIMLGSSGNGCGKGSGDGSGNDSGNGSGKGYGDGSGSGSGKGYGDGSGSGSGNDSGDGFGDGYGNDSGNGFGDGYGNDSGNDSGNGFGDGYKISSIVISGKEYKPYDVDGLATFVYSVNLDRGILHGFWLNPDCTATDCYVVARDGYMAHGETLHEAYDALNEKIEQCIPLEERIGQFVKEFPSGIKREAKDYYRWHHTLTGSCEFGRNAFMESHGIGMDETYTPEDFIRMTENDYGGDIIRRLKTYYKSVN